MDTTHHFELIDGTFLPKEASQILGTMVKNKIAYHTLERHSESEISGGGKTRSKERLEQLRELDANLKELFEKAARANKNLKISGHLRIDFVD